MICRLPSFRYLRLECTSRPIAGVTRAYSGITATKVLIKRTEERLGLKPIRLAADTAYDTGRFLDWLMTVGIAPHIPVWDMSQRDDGTFSRANFVFNSKQRFN